MRQFAVIGLGTFGQAAALELMRLDNAVIGIDNEPKLVEAGKNDLTYAVIADATDEQALSELNLTSYDAVLVAIGEHLEASLLCVVALKNIGVNAIWVKAKSAAHHAILSQMGVEFITHPEQEMGIQIAQSMSNPLVQQYLSLGDEYYLVKLAMPKRFAGQVLQQVLMQWPQVTLYALKRGNHLVRQPETQLVLQPADQLIVGGRLDHIRRFARDLLTP